MTIGRMKNIRFLIGIGICTLLTIRSTDMPLTNDGAARCFNND